MNMKLTLSLSRADEVAISGWEEVAEATETFPLDVSGAYETTLIHNGRVTLNEAIKRVTEALQEKGLTWIATTCEGARPKIR